MSGFKNVQKELDPSSTGNPDEVRIIKVDEEAGTGNIKVEPFQFHNIDRSFRNYESVKAKYGALASSDEDRPHRSKRDARFSINPMAKERLSIEEEDRRVIEEKAAARVKEILAKAQPEAEKRGYEDGLKKGYEEASAKIRTEGERRLASFDTVLAELEGAKVSIFRANERYLIELIYRISRQVLLRDLKMDREYAARLCRQVVERIGVKENIRIGLSEDDFAFAESIREGLEKSFGGLRNLQIERSARVKTGGCLVETDWNAIDASIDTQLDGIYEALLGAASAPSTEKLGTATDAPEFSGSGEREGA